MTVKDYIDKCKSRDIVYPRAVARGCDATMKKAYKELETFVGQDIKRMCKIRCPKCCSYLNKRYYSLSDIPKDFCCVDCGAEFFVDHENDVIVLYEKI